MHTDDTEAAIAEYIQDKMPLIDPTLCEGACANDVAAYLWELINTTEPPAPIGDIANGETIFKSTQCSICHTDNGDGTATGNPSFDINSLGPAITAPYSDTVESLASYISEQMSRVGTCDEQCGKDIAAYLWQFRD